MNSKVKGIPAVLAPFVSAGFGGKPKKLLGVPVIDRCSILNLCK